MAQATKSLPARPNLEYLKKLAKERLAALRAERPSAKLADAQLAIARSHGFPSWRKLKAHVDELRSSPQVNLPHVFGDLVKAIVGRDNETVRVELARAPQVVNRTGPHPHWGGRPQPLHVAIESGNEDALRLLLDAGADVDGDNSEYDGWSPLMLSAHWQRAGMTAALLRRGARVGLIEALMLADDQRVRQILRDDPAAAHRTPVPNNGSALHFARTRAAVEMLLHAGVSPMTEDKYGRTAIESAAMLGSQARELVEAMRTHRSSRDAEMPPHALAAMGDLKGLKAALARTSDAVLSARTVHAAATQGQVGALAWLVDTKGADVNARDADGATPLHAAAWAGQLAAVQLLLKFRADPTIKDAKHSATPLDWARRALTLHDRKDCAPIVELLMRLAEPAAPSDEDAKMLRRLRAPHETHVLVERRGSYSDRGPRWTPDGMRRADLRERDVSQRILARGNSATHRIISIWRTVKVERAASGNSVSRLASGGPTRALERWVGKHEHPNGGLWQRVDWPSQTQSMWLWRERNEDLDQAMRYLRESAEPGTYRIISVRRMMWIKRAARGRVAVVAKHAGMGKDGQFPTWPMLAPVSAAREPDAPPRKSSRDWKPIMDAAFHGDVEKIESLLKAGADPNIVSGTMHRYRPLHRAIELKKTYARGENHAC